MERDHYIFELPIYRLSEDTWLNYVEHAMNEYVERFLQHQYRDYGLEPTSDDRKRAASFASQSINPNGWTYNETIGWIKLKHDGPGPVIKGYLWLVAKTGIDRHEHPRTIFRKGFVPFPFFYWHKVSETWLFDEQSNEEIFNEIRNDVSRLEDRSGMFEKRYIDFQAFDNVAPFIDWRRLLGFEHQSCELSAPDQ